jgi:hypothetical protein
MGAVGVLVSGPVGAADEPAGVSIDVAKDHIDFRLGKNLVTRYHIGPEVAKPYFWPVNAPNGVPVTRAWPMEKPQPGEKTDHVHQKSGWFCHGDVIPEGIELKHKIRGVEGIDFWAESAGHGKIVCTKVGEPKVDRDHGQITTVNDWRTADGVKVLEETRTIHLYNLGGAPLLVFDIDLRASEVPIIFGDTKEGSLGVRLRDSITEERGKGKLTNAEGHVGEGKNNNRDGTGCWGVISAWCDYSGPADGKTAGLALFADPANPYPTCWHARGYGLMAANPFGREKSGFPAMKGKKDLVKLAKGEHLKLRYGLFLHAGDVQEGKVAENYAKFVKLKG